MAKSAFIPVAPLPDYEKWTPSAVKARDALKRVKLQNIQKPENLVS